MGVGVGFWRDRILDAMALCRFLDVYQWVSGQTCTALLYHSVAGGRGVPYFDGDVFASHMDMLRSEFHVIGADEYLGHLTGRKRLPRRSVLITFDDGFANNYTIVQPIMEARQLPWALFPTTQCLDEPDQPLWFVAVRAI